MLHHNYSISLMQSVYHWEILLWQTQETHQQLFTAIQDKCSKLGFDVDPVTVTTDFELSVINAFNSSYEP